MSFQVGDQVRIKYFKRGIYPIWWAMKMKEMSGDIKKIENISKDKNRTLPYRLFNCIWGWKESDFESIDIIEKFESEDFEI